jgi:hypothetical protein
VLIVVIIRSMAAERRGSLTWIDLPAGWAADAITGNERYLWPYASL